MEDDEDQGADAKKKTQPLTREEIQTKFYLEGPEAAPTQQYIELKEKFELSQLPSTSWAEPQESPESQDDYSQNKDVEAGTVPPLVQEKAGTVPPLVQETTISTSVSSELHEGMSEYSLDPRYIRPRLSDLAFSRMKPGEQEIVMRYERKQVLYAKILKYVMSENDNPKRRCYFDADQHNDEDFYIQPDDYPDTDWHHHFYTFYKKYQPLLLFLKAFIQVLVFLAMLAAMIYVDSLLAPDENTEVKEEVPEEKPVFFEPTAA